MWWNMLNPNWATWIKKRVLPFILWALLTVWTASFTIFNAISFKRVAFSVLRSRMWKLQISWTSNLMKPNALYYFFRQQWKIRKHELYLLEQHSRLKCDIMNVASFSLQYLSATLHQTTNRKLFAPQRNPCLLKWCRAWTSGTVAT